MQGTALRKGRGKPLLALVALPWQSTVRLLCVYHFHFLTMSWNPNLLSLSHLEDACGHLFCFFLKLHIPNQSFFLVYAVKETDGENHGRKKANKMQPPSS